MPEGVGGWIAFLLEKCAMPIGLAAAGWFVSTGLERDRQAAEQARVAFAQATELTRLTMERERIDQVILPRAMEVLFGKDSQERIWGAEVGTEERRIFRGHWIATYNSYARVDLQPSEIAALMEVGLDQRPRPQGTAGTPPTPITVTPPQPGQPDIRGDGWVSVGRPDSTRYADRNFDLLGDARFKPDGTLPPDTVMRARWSVNLRTSTGVTSGEGNPARGLLAAGDCARVLTSRANVRGGTWAFVDRADCGTGG